jgi:hypothetical protein
MNKRRRTDNNNSILYKTVEALEDEAFKSYFNSALVTLFPLEPSDDSICTIVPIMIWLYFDHPRLYREAFFNRLAPTSIKEKYFDSWGFQTRRLKEGLCAVQRDWPISMHELFHNCCDQPLCNELLGCSLLPVMNNPSDTPLGLWKEEGPLWSPKEKILYGTARRELIMLRHLIKTLRVHAHNEQRVHLYWRSKCHIKVKKAMQYLVLREATDNNRLCERVVESLFEVIFEYMYGIDKSDELPVESVVYEQKVDGCWFLNKFF